MLWLFCIDRAHLITLAPPPQKKNILQLVYASLLQADIVLVTVSEHSATNTGSLQGKL